MVALSNMFSLLSNNRVYKSCVVCWSLTNVMHMIAMLLPDYWKYFLILSMSVVTAGGWTFVSSISNYKVSASIINHKMNMIWLLFPFVVYYVAVLQSSIRKSVYNDKNAINRRKYHNVIISNALIWSIFARYRLPPQMYVSMDQMVLLCIKIMRKN